MKANTSSSRLLVLASHVKCMTQKCIWCTFTYHPRLAMRKAHFAPCFLENHGGISDRTRDELIDGAISHLWVALFTKGPSY